MLSLSQGHLNVLSTCPRKFQNVYLERLNSPTNQQQQERLSWGNRFHLLMQQRELGLPVEPLLQEEELLEKSLEALLAAVPEMRSASEQVWRDAEHYRTLKFGDYLLTVVYDLLLLTPQTAKILDWKTYLKPENPTRVAHSWQTRLYLYVLAETSAYHCEQLEMTYWFVRLPDAPQKLTLNYSSDRHQQTHQDLERLLSSLTTWWPAYREHGTPFPQVNISDGKCRTCPYQSRCDRDSQANPTPDWSQAIASISEVRL